jgi:hypothetical protein
MRQGMKAAEKKGRASRMRAKAAALKKKFRTAQFQDECLGGAQSSVQTAEKLAGKHRS